MMSRYVIQVEDKFIQWCNILSEEGIVSIGKVGAYTDKLIDARVFDDYEKEEDISAWETFFKSKHGEGFEYKEIEFVIK